MTRAGIAFGSNIPDRLRHLTMARMMISELPEVSLPMLASAVYETEPIGCEPGAENFLNAVIEIGWTADAPTLHRALRHIERAIGRSPAHQRNASREIDLDLLYFGEVEIATDDLRVPHQRMHERRFVLEPLAEISAELVLAGQTQTVGELLRQLADTSQVVRADSQW